MSLYSTQLLALSKDTTHRAPLASPTHSARVSNSLCGDVIEVEVVLHQGRIQAISFAPRACAVCQASAALMSRLVLDADLHMISEASSALERALSGEGSDPRFEALSPLTEHPSRRACARLPWRALEDALLERAPMAQEVAEPETLTPSAWADALRRLSRGDDVALATLLSVVGSAPCPPGSRMVISSDGSFWGAVSGGCVESAVVHAAVELLSRPRGTRDAEILEYQISNSQAGEVGLMCGGQIRVHITRCPGEQELRTYIQATRSGAVRVVSLQDGTSEVVSAPGQAPAALRSMIRGCLDRDEPVEVAEQGLFLEPLLRPRRLVLVGGTKVAQTLCVLAREVGYEPVLLDPRRAMASPERFPHVRLCQERPEDGLGALLDSRAAVVMLTHDEALDDPALLVSLSSPAFYVGALGSRKTQRGRLERLRRAGVSDELLQRLHGPAGLAIGAKGPAEIALSIMAQVVQAQRRSDARERVGALVLQEPGSDAAGAVTACERAGLETKVVHPGSEHEAFRSGLRELGVVDAVLVLGSETSCPASRAISSLLRARSVSTQHLVLTLEGPDEVTLWPRRCLDGLMTPGQTQRSIMDAAPGAVLRVEVLP